MENEFKPVIEEIFLEMETKQTFDVKIEADPLSDGIKIKQIKEEDDCKDNFAMSTPTGLSENKNGYLDCVTEVDDCKQSKTYVTLIKAEISEKELVIKDENDIYEGDTNATSEDEDNLPLIQRANARVGVPKTNNGTEENPLKSPGSAQYRGQDSCLFCKKLVLNFARHIMRNHLSEYEVQEIFSHPANTLVRRQLLTALRKKGNYMRNSIACVKPVRKGRDKVSGEYLPCPKCLGFYTRKHIWRHRKVCDQTDSVPNAQVECQNFLVKDMEVDSELQERVFPVMRADKVSLVAKKDRLICAFGAQYLKSHPEGRFSTITSRKMRHLSKFLMEIQELQPSIKDLLDSLKPQNYDLIVAATKRAAGYDEEKQDYASPTFALNIGTFFRQCCDIALALVNCEERTQVEDFSSLLEDNWRRDISFQAADSMYKKKAIKLCYQASVSLADDLKLLIDYLLQIAEKNGAKLTTSPCRNVDAYNDLLESVYCRVILFNRIQCKEVSEMLLSEYDNLEVGGQLNSACWITERILGKTCRSVEFATCEGSPFLFSQDVQKDIDILKSVRNIHVPEDNWYLFGKANSQNHLSGFRLIRKHAKLCGAKNPNFFSVARWSKDIATLAQIFNMSNTDMEELTACLGLTGPVQKLHNDTHQAAKMTKLLLLIDDGEADNYMGQSLEEIDIDVVVGTEKDTEMLEPYTQPSPKPKPERKYMSGRKRILRIPWSAQQKDAVINYFSNHIRNKKPPKRHECDEVKHQYPELLQNKDWLKIKVFIQNVYTKKCETERYKDIVSEI